MKMFSLLFAWIYQTLCFTAYRSPGPGKLGYGGEKIKHAKVPFLQKWGSFEATNKLMYITDFTAEQQGSTRLWD